MPSLPSNANFKAALEALSVTGVERTYTYVPGSVDLANGYCAIISLPTGERGEQVSTCVNNSKTRSVVYAIIIEATAQSTPEDNYDALAPVMDNLETALDSLSPGTVNYVTYGIDTTANYLIGDVAHWAVIANLTVSDQ